MAGGFMRKLAGFFRPRSVVAASHLERSATWLDQEEQRQMNEVRDRLERVREQLRTIDRRRTPRGVRR